MPLPNTILNHYQVKTDRKMEDGDDESQLHRQSSNKVRFSPDRGNKLKQKVPKLAINEDAANKKVSNLFDKYHNTWGKD